jgi:hypothetical protein
MDAPTMAGLRRYNLIAAAAHAVQGVLVLALANDFTLPVTATYLEGPPGTTPADQVVLWDLPVAMGVALFFFLSAAAHLTVASPSVFPRYGAGLAAGHNYYRWLEYSL